MFYPSSPEVPLVRVAHPHFLFLTLTLKWLALSSCQNGSIDICSEKRCFGVQYAGDVVLLREDSVKLQGFLDHRKDNMRGIFGMLCAF